MSDRNDKDHGKDVHITIVTSLIILSKTVADLQDCLHVVSWNLKVRLKNSRERVGVEGGTQTRDISERLHNKQHDSQPKAVRRTTRKGHRKRNKRAKMAAMDTAAEVTIISDKLRVVVE
jgi:hypothetical protein